MNEGELAVTLSGFSNLYSSSMLGYFVLVKFVACTSWVWDKAKGSCRVSSNFRGINILILGITKVQVPFISLLYYTNSIKGSSTVTMPLAYSPSPLFSPYLSHLFSTTFS